MFKILKITTVEMEITPGTPLARSNVIATASMDPIPNGIIEIKPITAEKLNIKSDIAKLMF